jgi:hypothetical protein
MEPRPRARFHARSGSFHARGIKTLSEVAQNAPDPEGCAGDDPAEDAVIVGVHHQPSGFGAGAEIAPGLDLSSCMLHS